MEKENVKKEVCNICCTEKGGRRASKLEESSTEDMIYMTHPLLFSSFAIYIVFWRLGFDCVKRRRFTEMYIEFLSHGNSYTLTVHFI